MKMTLRVQTPSLWHELLSCKLKEISERALQDIYIATGPRHETQPYAVIQSVMCTFSMCAKSSWTAEVTQDIPVLPQMKLTPWRLLKPTWAPASFLLMAGWKHCEKDAIMSLLRVYKECVWCVLE